MDARGIGAQEKLVFLPVDFERESLAERWIESSAPDFISWLGSTYYLTREAISTTLQTLAGRTQPGTRLVVDYWSEPPLPSTAGALLWSTRTIVALQGETMHSFFEPADFAALAARCGWRMLENCSPDYQTRRYLAPPHDGLRVPAFAWLAQLER